MWRVFSPGPTPMKHCLPYPYPQTVPACGRASGSAGARACRASAWVALVLCLVCSWSSRAGAIGPVTPGVEYGRLLAEYAGPGGIDYGRLHASLRGRQRLAKLVASLERMADDAPLADWLNAYNLIVIKAVIDHYPMASVKEVPGFFDGLKFQVAGKQRSLDDIENRVIRPRFQDARIHFALNCAARSCPVLAKRPFRQARLDATLDRLVRSALRSPQHLRRVGDQLQVSALFFWFAKDFQRDAGSVMAWIARHAPAKSLQGLPAQVALEQIDYDWALAQR